MLPQDLCHSRAAGGESILYIINEPCHHQNTHMYMYPWHVHITCTHIYTYIHVREMIHHHGASQSMQQTFDLLICHGTQQDSSLSTV